MPAFFFFFQAAHSPDYESPEFIAFCEACFAVRRFKPTLTLSALRTVLAIASEAELPTFEQVSARLGQDYSPTMHQIGQLAEGRGTRDGLKLLKRIKQPGTRIKKVALSRTGRAVAHRMLLQAERDALFALPQEVRAERLAEMIGARVLPALDHVVRQFPTMTLGTFCVLLYVVRHQADFAYEGRPAKEITDALGISNLVKHLSNLGLGREGQPGFGLLDPVAHGHDGRITLPALSVTGTALISGICGFLLARAPVVPKRIRAEKLVELEKPSDVAEADDDWYEPIERLDDIEWKEKGKGRGR